MKSNNTNTIIFCAAMIVLAAFLRISNVEIGVFNLVPLAAMSLFSGAVIRNKSLAYMIPLGALLISDTYLHFTKGIGFYGIAQVFVYIGMMLVTLLGTSIKNFKSISLLGYTLSGSLLFWVVSNLGVFAEGWYGYSLTGLMNTFMMAIPFLENEMATQLFVNSIVSDMIMSVVLFGAYKLVAKNAIAVAKV